VLAVSDAADAGEGVSLPDEVAAHVFCQVA
jgi:hypothetical protein